ncbi:tRNA lysidine(34) synthetase TilS [Devosia sp. 63-57]|uniref:tRNA lysidine(34) synthetase TilS n=1 Tax=Devosia sp. 63-57 TaxID=1895751 RepID=UPI00086CF93D|nr:tRNA lysidine(34) synthetase TilS [Devosia sp. 63-57]ODT48816.1 MAG: tRNA lysidine(34) synthetase TilS [Pelagibacterium sp. SCN 63-126]ODU86895.1 MAG: tRNA lysidine(34) synthetase TilS [Pelagibacterium sp. SCN 63-17]OJX44256.1 MAG: tRNA lysidine(34) synthetase TilS [Devosia sp. 63-57]
MSTGLTPDLGDPDVLARLFAPARDHRTIGLAVSGGADSLALMLLAHRWAAMLAEPPKLIVYSLDHALRPEAADEVAMVLAAADNLGLSARGLVWDDIKPETGLQEAARQARYGLIGGAMAEDGATLLLTAHHRADQAETVLMRLAHGSGLEGLKAMSPLSRVEGVPLFRPLLDCDPASLAALVAEAGLIPAADPSNTDPAYERVRWRQLLPTLAAEGLDAATLSRFATRMAEADAALTQMAHAAFDELVRLDGFGAASLPRAALTELSPAIAQRVLSRVLNIVGGRQKPRALGQVERLHEQILGGISKPLTLLGAVIRPRAESLVISREPGRMLPEAQTLLPGADLVWDQRFLISNLSGEAGIQAGPTDFLPRHRLEALLGFKVTSPAEAIRTAPIVHDSAGQLLALGGWSFDERVKVELLID